MPKYEVTRAWHGVSVGDVVELEQLHPALKSNVRLIRGEAAGVLDPATPAAATLNKGEVAKRLKELRIEFDGRKGAEELAALLPDGDPLKPRAE